MYYYASIDGDEIKLYREHWVNNPEMVLNGTIVVCEKCYALVVKDYAWYHDDLHSQLEELQDQVREIKEC